MSVGGSDCPKREPYVANAMSRLDNAVEKLKGLIGGLDNRFSTVLRSEIQPETAINKVSEDSVELSETLNKITGRINEANKKIASIIDRCELSQGGGRNEVKAKLIDREG